MNIQARAPAVADRNKYIPISKPEMEFTSPPTGTIWWTKLAIYEWRKPVETSCGIQAKLRWDDEFVQFLLS